MGGALPTLLLERSAQAIEKVIIPRLTDGSTAMQAALIATFLHVLAPTVEEKGKDLIEENEGIREVLGKVLDTLSREKALCSNIVCHELLEELERELRKDGSERVELSEENERLRVLLVKVIKAFDALKAYLPEDMQSFLRNQIRRVIRQELDHALARVAGFDMKKIVQRK